MADKTAVARPIWHILIFFLGGGVIFATHRTAGAPVVAFGGNSKLWMITLEWKTFFSAAKF